MWHRVLLTSIKRQTLSMETWNPPMFYLELILRPASQTTALPCLQTLLLVKILILQLVKHLRLARLAVEPLPNLMSMHLVCYYWSFWLVNIHHNIHTLCLLICWTGSEQWEMTVVGMTTSLECLLKLLVFVAWPHRNRGRQCGKC